MHPSEPDPIFPAPRRPRKGPEKLVRKWVVSGQVKHPGGAQCSRDLVVAVRSELGSVRLRVAG